MKAYQEDLSLIHHVGFTHFLKNCIPYLLKILREHDIKNGHIVDIGCGSGVWAKQLLTKGYSVSGTDISPHMIEIAKQNAPLGNFVVGSYLDYRIPSCDAITAFGEVFNYLFDKKNNLKKLTAFFKSVYKSLKPGGLFIFDIAVPGRGGNVKQKHVDGDNWTVLVDVDEDKKKNLLTRNIISFLKVNDLYRRSDEKHLLQLYKASEISKILKDIGFKVRMVKRFGNYTYPKGWGAIIAQKKKF